MPCCDIIYLFEYFRGLSDLVFTEYFAERKVPYTSRRNKFKKDTIIKFKPVHFQHCFYSRVPLMWDAFPKEIAAENNVDSYKRRLRNFHLSTNEKFTVKSSGR